MKILVLSDDFPPNVIGGAGVMAFRISKGFFQQGHDVFVITTTQDKEKEGVVLINGMKIYSIYSNYHERWRSYVSLYNRKTIKRIEEIIKDVSPDVVHVHNIHAHISYFSLLVSKKYVRKVILTAHDIMSFYPGTFTEFIDSNNLSCVNSFNYKVNAFILIKKFRLRYNPIRNIFIRYVLSKIDKVVSVSDALREALSQNKINNSLVIYNGIDIKDWSVPEEDISNFKNKFKIENLNVVLFQGRLSGAKGGDLILSAINLISKKNPEVRLLVVGKRDGYGEKMLQRARALGIEDNIVFTGWLDESEIKKAYASSDVIAIPSVCFDSFPNGNLEGGASKRPIVATCFGGSREIIKDDINGYVVNPFDVNLLSERINSLLIDNTKLKEFGERGYSIVQSNFSMNKTVDEYLDLFLK